MIATTIVVACALVGLLVFILGRGPSDEAAGPVPVGDTAPAASDDDGLDGQVGAPATGPAGPSASQGDGAAGAPAADDSVRNVERDDETGAASSQPAPDDPGPTPSDDGASSATPDGDGDVAVDPPAEAEAEPGADEAPPTSTFNGPTDGDSTDTDPAGDDDDDDDRPVVEPPGDRSTPAGEGVVLAIRAGHDDDDVLRYAAQGLPPGLAIHTGTGVITGSPTETGIWEVTVTVTAGDDDDDASSQTFTWTVTAAPDTDGCAQEGRARSRASVTAITFEVVNQTAGVLDVYWLNHSGNRVRIHTVAPTETVTVDSFETNPWLVADAGTGACLRLLTDPADGDRLVLQQ